MAKARECLSKPKKRDDRWAVKVLVGFAVTAVASGFFLLRFGSEIPTGYKAATNRPLVRKENRPTLSLARFIGKAARAHEVAQEIPDILDQLHCYCDCEKHMNHRSLLSCYTDGHAGTCDICIEEALEASRLYNEGKGMQDIRARIDRQFVRL